jgi:hypothetical protein
MIRLFKSVFLSNDKFTQPGTQQIFVTPSLSIAPVNRDFVMEDYDTYDEVIRMYKSFDEFIKMCDIWVERKQRPLVIHADYYSYSKLLQSWLRMILPNVDCDTSYKYYNAYITSQLLTRSTGILDSRMDANTIYNNMVPFDQWKRSWNRSAIQPNQNTVEWIEDNKHSFDGIFALSTYENTGQMFDAVSSVIVRCIKRTLSSLIKECKRDAFSKVMSGELGEERYDMSNIHTLPQTDDPLIKILYDTEKLKSVILVHLDDKNYFDDSVNWDNFTQDDIDKFVHLFDKVGTGYGFEDLDVVRWAFNVAKNNKITYNDYDKFVKREQRCKISFVEHDFMLQYYIKKREDRQMMWDYSLI